MARAEFVSARVYDPVLRLQHWANALLIVALWVTGLVSWLIDPGSTTAWLHDWHGRLGTVLIVSFSARLAWGFAGPEHARFAEMWQPTVWRKAITDGRVFIPPARFGHHPVASLAYLALYALLAGLALTGLMLLAIEQGRGPFSLWLGWHAAFQGVPAFLHEISAWLVLGFVIMHLSALGLHQRLHRVPMATAMITGVQYLPRHPDKRTDS